MDSNATLAFFLSELESQDVAQCVQAVRQMPIIALALGKEWTREKLIPSLTGLLEGPEAQFPDEVKCCIGEVLGKDEGKFVEFVGGAPHAAILLSPLIILINEDETAVREIAVASFNAIGKHLSARQIQEALPFLTPEKLAAAYKEWYSPRVSICGLCALAYAKVDDATWRADVLATFKSLANDESPMVRRGAASSLAGLAAVLKTDDLTSVAAPLLKSIIEDVNSEKSQDSVRENAVKAVPKILALLCQFPDATAEVVQAYKSACADKSWRVRKEVAEVVAQVAKAVKAEQAAAVGLVWNSLVVDAEFEVKTTALLKGDLVAAALGSAFTEQEIFPLLRDFVVPSEICLGPKRVELAAVLAKLAGPLGKAKTMALLLPELKAIVELEQPGVQLNVRLAVIGQFKSIIDVVGLPDPLLDLIKSCTIPHEPWRIRHAVLLLLPNLCNELGPDAFFEIFDLRDFAFSPYHLIREAFASVVVGCLAVKGMNAFGDKISDILKEGIAKGSMTSKSAVLSILCHFPLTEEFCHVHRVEQFALECLERDQPPNLRIRAAEALGQIGACKASCPQIMEKLQQLTNAHGDDDPDVTDWASVALKKLSP